MKSFAALIIFFSSAAAFALTQTEQTLTPRGQQFELRGGGNYNYWDTSYNNGSSLTLNGFQIPVSAYYGINDMNAIGFSFNYKSFTSDAKPVAALSYQIKEKGFEYFAVGYKGNFDISRVTLVLQADFLIPPEKNSTNMVTYNFSASHGQMGLAGRVGLVAPVGMAKLGGLVGYRYNLEGDGTYTNGTYNNVATKVTGGNELSAQIFAEVENSYNPNISIGYSTTEETQQKNSGSVLTRALKRDYLTLRGSMRFLATENLDIIPYASYSMLMNKGDTNIDADKWNQFVIGADARFLF